MQYVGLCNVQCTSCWGMSSCYVVFQSNEGSEMKCSYLSPFLIKPVMPLSMLGVRTG